MIFSFRTRLTRIGQLNSAIRSHMSTSKSTYFFEIFTILKGIPTSGTVGPILVLISINGLWESEVTTNS